MRATLPGYRDPAALATMVEQEEAVLGVPAATAPGPPDAAGGPQERLSQRETDVLRMLRSEFSLPEIATHLYVSYNTVKTHTRTIYRKLGATSRAQAVARGRAQGYL